MADKICPKCNIPYSGECQSDPKVTHCLLCGAVLAVSQTVGVEIVEEHLPTEPKSKTKKVRAKKDKVNSMAAANIQTITCEVTEISEKEFRRRQPQTAKQINLPQTGSIEEIKPFGDTGGFSKRNGKEELEIEQLKADNEALRKRLNGLEGIYKEQHPEPKPWYGDIGKWFTLLLVLGMIYLIYWFVESQGGLPHEFYNLLRIIGL